MSFSRPTRHHLCPSPQLHQVHQFVLRLQPLSKTPSSYFEGGNIGAFNTFVETISLKKM
jgi:hypothetical protein